MGVSSGFLTLNMDFWARFGLLVFLKSICYGIFIGCRRLRQAVPHSVNLNCVQINLFGARLGALNSYKNTIANAL